MGFGLFVLCSVVLVAVAAIALYYFQGYLLYYPSMPPGMQSACVVCVCVRVCVCVVRTLVCVRRVCM